MRVEQEAQHPQKEPLVFDVQVEGLSLEFAEIITYLKQSAENVLFHWKTFPIILPQPVNITSLNGDSIKKKFSNLRDVFVTPSFDEVDSVALDAKGDSRRLNDKQLQNIQQWGEFEVESINFSGQFHKWKLSRWLQNGSFTARETLLNDVALALKFVLITGWNRIHSSFFSLYKSILSLRIGIFLLCDCIFGAPSLLSEDSIAKLAEERSKYLVTELIVPRNLDDELDFLCLFIKRRLQKIRNDSIRYELDAPPGIPYLYQTPKGVNIDLRLFNKDLIKEVLPHLSKILEKDSRGWFPNFREKIVFELKTQKLSDEEIEKQANKAVMDEYLKRVYESILNDENVRDLGQGIGQLLVEQAYSVVQMHRALDDVQFHWTQICNQIKHNLIDSHPILSRINDWLKMKLEAAEAKYKAEHQWDAHETALQACREHQLHQAFYFLYRDLVFIREREPVLVKELERVKVPNRVFQWRRPIWFPKHWIIRKIHHGEIEVIPTVLGNGPISSSISHSEGGYVVEKHISHSTNTSWLLWRWTNFFWRSWTWLWNAIYYFGVVIPWCSPVGFLALFSYHPFMPDFEPNVDGTLVPRRSSATLTMCSRLMALWRHISKSMTEFETRPDRGFIGRGFTRLLNRVWNYIFKGLFGTIALAVFFPIICFLVSLTSLALAFTAIAWVPFVAAIFHLCCILIYDFDSPSGSCAKWSLIPKAVVWEIAILGVFQPIFASIIATFICPIISFFILIWAIVKWSASRMWDTIMFHIVIKRRGRIPASDGYLVKRVAGPGMTSNFFYQIVPEQCLVAFEAKLELEELTAFYEETCHFIKRPQNAFSEFVKVCFHPFSATLVKDGIYQQLEKEAAELHNALREKVDQRIRSLTLGLGVSVRSKVKMIKSDLQAFLNVASVTVEAFYPDRIFPRLSVTEDKFWENRLLPFRDWSGLAAQLLTEIFSQDIVTPLEDGDVKFKLGMQNTNLSNYSELLREISASNDLDFIGIFNVPKGHIQIQTPYLNVAIFNPVYKRDLTDRLEPNRSRFYPWRSHSKSVCPPKLKVPLLLPHPVQVAIVVYNREADDPIPLEWDSCRNVMKVIEDSVRQLSTEFVDINLSPVGSQCSVVGKEGTPLSTVDSEAVSSRKRNSVRVNLASAEDITLDLDSEKVTYSHNPYSTTV